MPGRGHTCVSRKGTYEFPFSRYPAVRIALLLISGVLLGEAFSGVYYLPLGIFGVLAIGLWVLKRANPQSFSIRLTRHSNILLLLLIVAFGWFRSSLNTTYQGSNNTEELLSVMVWESVSVIGTVETYSINSNGKLRADVTILETTYSDFWSNEEFKSRVLFEERLQIDIGDTLSFSGTILPISEKRNPHQFDYKSFLDSKNIRTQFRVDLVHRISKNRNIFSWSWWQTRAREIIKINFDPVSQPLANALLLGHKNDLDQETKKAFSRTGLSHIMAVSGLHVGFIIAPIWVFLPRFRRMKYGKTIGIAVVIITLFLSVYWAFEREVLNV